MWVCHRKLRSILPIVLVLLSPAVGADDSLKQAHQLLDSLTNSATTSRYAQVAREYGPVIDSIRSRKTSLERLHELRKLTDQFRARTSGRLKAAEAEAGDSEGRLEALYRSSAWDDLSFALAAFPYWGAWIDLEIAKKISDHGERAPWLWKAKKGFRSTSVQVFRPSLIYGGWLGLGYVAAAEKKYDQALSIFESLQNALTLEPNNPLYEVVTVEIRLLQAQGGDVAYRPTSSNIDEQEAKILRIETFALLEKFRTSQEGGQEAADRLRRLVRAGYVDNDLVTQILNYRVELVNFDIGAWTHLAAAEYAFEYGHFFDAVQKFKRFFSAVEITPGLNLDRYRYRHALANYKAKLHDDAAGIAERLGRKEKLDPEIKKAAIKLAYAARAARASKGTASARRALQRAAQQFVSAYPNDPDADGARLSIAQLTADSEQAFYQLNNVKKPSKLQGGVEQTKFYILARDFASSLRKNRTKQLEPTARRGIAAFKKLPNEQRRVPENVAIVIQMRSLVDDAPDKVLGAIDKMEEKLSLSITAREALLWARLKCFERMGNYDQMLSYLNRLAESSPEGWQMEQIYPAIKALPSPQNRFDVANAMLPSLTNLPSMDRRFRVMIIDAQLELGKFETAYTEAKTFLELYPRAGDGWRVFAIAAARTDKPFEADRAWKTITERSDPRRDIWWEGMISRATIRAESTRPEAACEIMEEIRARKTQMPATMDGQISELDSKVKAVVNCGPATT